MATQKFTSENVNATTTEKAKAFINLYVTSKSGRRISLGKSGIALYESREQDMTMLRKLLAKESLDDLDLSITVKLAETSSTLEDEEI